MADEVDSLILEASVVDDFSDELDELETSLMEVEGTGEAVNPIDMDVQIGDALADIELIKQRLRSIQDEVNVDVDTQWEQAQIFGNLQADDAEMWDMFNFHDNANFGTTPTGGVWLRDVGGGENPIRNAPSVGTRDQHGNFRGAPGLWAEGAGGDVAKDLVQAQSEATDILMGEREGGRNRSMREVIQDFSSFRLSMGMLMNMLAALVPLIGVFVGALPAAIAGVMGLATAALAAAGALYGIVGLGLLGMATTGGEFDFDTLRARIQSTIDEFLAAFSPLGDAMQPLVEDVFTNMQALFFDVAMRMRQLMSVSDEARQAMDFLFDAVGPVLEQTVMLGEIAIPLVLGLMERLASIDFFGTMAGVLADTLPWLVMITAAIGRMLPAIFELSEGFLIAVWVLTEVASRAFQLINLFPGVAMALGLLTSALFVAISASALYSIATGAMMARVWQFAASAIPAAVKSLHVYIASQVGATAATVALTLATMALISVVTLGIGSVLTFGSAFSFLGNDISSATDQLRDFNRMSRRTSMHSPNGRFSTPGGGPRYSKPTSASSSQGSAGTVQNTVVAPDKETGNAVANTLGFMQGKSSSKTSGDQVSDRQHGI